jgi:hypothetical protein
MAEIQLNLVRTGTDDLDCGDDMDCGDWSPLSYFAAQPLSKFREPSRPKAAPPQMKAVTSHSSPNVRQLAAEGIKR